MRAWQMLDRTSDVHVHCRKQCLDAKGNVNSGVGGVEKQLAVDRG